MSVYQGKKENSTVQNNIVSGFSFLFKEKEMNLEITSKWIMTNTNSLKETV
jgi:hypothetical protein